ncbi:hypothetical protein KL949_002835 [Ogataea haglerorum]|uniref:Uncharacterized protein n=1 Tax=Ogataea haglerorum TaxID=1937702 RepID=A0ABQ7RF46_9ASCO|nr:uncharacterized protein KL911_003245 [Ogataea haglerorum]KAG7705591.1 hypothetical protein KL914_003429 [Ogataea haglerorum]KAG7718312.1 hypothetical protein KL913_002307 [Ogataea haglerorum]KAG7718839.1 hypothetical protein KL949_002835 [Ogataea haglerorum]KAG7737543.1 hypothetical protein KL923_003932 [Ogataea haglerorum]KAG7747472.1 hypothetical protein KL912_003496 [Ogataea haglerorum]
MLVMPPVNCFTLICDSSFQCGKIVHSIFLVSSWLPVLDGSIDDDPEALRDSISEPEPGWEAVALAASEDMVLLARKDWYGRPPVRETPWYGRKCRSPSEIRQ